ncbi:hypothetical protein [Candidatus Formimonas warabiya]|uniref:hypothetical protein n=1 Tax=Formimonas warabiya TaxID=1761012 RepID=UPI001BE4582C|nr:hypothetical protein [Candidatus Formimonas warabiya]
MWRMRYVRFWIMHLICLAVLVGYVIVIFAFWRLMVAHKNLAEAVEEVAQNINPKKLVD